jgi:glycosyltransferase involved in cell wall biosynthesis
MIDCFILFEKIIPQSNLYFIGEGEDLQKIQEYLSHKQISGKVILTGRKKSEEISLYLNASDLFIMGSYKEGWSTSLSEAIACVVPSCVTNFSSAKEIVLEGKNGYVIEEHNEDLFVQGMLKAMKLSRPVYNENVRAYSTGKLKEDLLKLWELI